MVTLFVPAVAKMAVVMDLGHSVDFEGRHLVDLVNHLVVRKDNQKDYLVDIHCMLDDLLQDDTFDYRVDIDKEIFEEHFDVGSFQEDSFH